MASFTAPPNGCRGANGSRFAYALDAKSGARLGRADMVYFERGHSIGARYRVVQETGAEQLAIGIINASFAERAADALRRAAHKLAVNHSRIDDMAAVFNDPVPQRRDGAGFRIYLDQAGLHPIGHKMRATFQYIGPADREQFGNRLGKLMRPVPSLLRQIVQGNAFTCRTAYEACVKTEVGRVQLQQLSGCPQNIVPQCLCRERCCFSCQR